MANRILDLLSRKLGQYFDIEQRDENGKIIIEGEYQEQEEEPSYLSLKDQWTQDIISGDTSILETFIKQYQRDHKKIERLVYLFQDNLELARWLVSQNDNNLYLRLPIEIWEIVDQLVNN